MEAVLRREGKQREVRRVRDPPSLPLNHGGASGARPGLRPAGRSSRSSQGMSQSALWIDNVKVVHETKT